jgi:hypothetical protein
MRPLFGPRTVVEAAFLVAVPVIALEVGLRWYVIVVAGGIAYLLVVGVEAAVWREGKRGAAAPAAVAPEPAVAEAEQHVRVIQKEPEHAPTPVPVHVAHEPEPAQGLPRLVSVPEPEPEAMRVPAIEPEPEPEATPAAAVIRIGGPRQWNVWDLERVAREHAGGDPVADEERTFLLMYLRDFAGADGLLPADFDELVRQSFGGLAADL